MHTHPKSWAALPPLLLSALPLYAQQPLEPLVVTATRQETRAAELLTDVTVIDRAEIERNLGNTVTELLLRQPGIQGARTGGPGTATSLFVRGARSDQTKVLVDGIPVNSLDPSGSSLPNLPLADVERIEIVRGPASTLYGADAIGGVIQIFTRKGQPGARADGFVGYGSHKTFQSNAGISAGGEMWRLRADGHYAQSDSVSAQKDASNLDADRDPWRNHGGSASFSLLPAAGHELGLSYRQNEGRTRYDSGFVPAAGNFDDRLDFRTSQWHLFSKNRLAEFWTSTLRYGQSTDRQTSYGSWSPTGSTTEIRNTQFTWQNDVRLPLGQLLLAYERMEQHAGPASSFPDGNRLDNNSLLAGWSASLGAHRWQLSARRDDTSSFGGKNTYAAAYGYQINAEWRAQASYGTAFKAPSLYQLYAPYYGNADLKPEESKNRELAVVWERGGQQASATYYLNRVDNMIDGVAPFYVYENISRARLRGVTLAYGGRFGDWGLRASYDWLDATDEASGLRMGRRARNKALLEVTRHRGPLAAGVELAAVGSRFDRNDETGKMGGYGLVNLTMRYAVSKSLSVEGRIDNLLDKDYELARGYNTPGIMAFVGIRYKL